MTQMEQINVLIVICLIGILVNILLFIFIKDKIYEMYYQRNENVDQQSFESIDSRETI